MQKEFINYLNGILGERIYDYQSVSGGDISDAYVLKGERRLYFCKVNNEKFATDLFEKEKEGLEALKETTYVQTPRVIALGLFKGNAFLLMNYIESGPKSDRALRALGVSLANMHLSGSAEKFGWKTDNYIGKLIQKNTKHEHWLSFYLEERINVQFKLAVDQRLLNVNLLPSIEKMSNFCLNVFPELKPSLLHGDLWSGNYLISSDGIGYLIDPAVYYGHAEIDIAMTELFGGFSQSFYQAYSEIIPQERDYPVRRDIYQLYYYLVHLNLFGNTYYSPVMNIIQKYFK